MTADDPRARLPSVHILPAYYWLCTGCGRTCFGHGKPQPNELKRVVCLHCGLAYDVKQEEA
jgi:hypothetical protein